MPYAKKSIESKTRAVERHIAAKWGRVRFRDNRLDETKTSLIAAGGCWCGDSAGHDWPGRNEGAPHPIDGIPPGLTPRQRLREARKALQDAGVCPNCLGYPAEVTPDGWPWCETCLGTGCFPPIRASALPRWRKEHEHLKGDADGD